MTAPSDSLLDALRSERWYRDQIAHVVHEPARSARCRAPAEPLVPAVESLLERRSLSLYSHQAEALDCWRAGADVLVATRTASGKSLAFDLAMTEALIGDPAATALYLFPTKALAHDQLARLRVLDSELRLGARPAAYDGDTPSAERARVRGQSRIICSNPYGLHEYLPQSQGWARFLAGLRIVVLDEAHRYRGLFGSHVALVLRRLQRICERLGSSPRFMLASGTIANPGELGAALIGRPVTVVDDDGAPSGERTIALWDSLTDPDRSSLAQAADVVVTLARSGCRTLCFTGSRLGTELVADMAARRARDLAISPYRAGFTPSERRDVEARLRDGRLDAVVSTNALELGIDIGGLDAVVLTGYPGTIASTWQQIGRAGRAGQPSLAVMVAGDDAMDQYLVRRPEILFGSPVERAVTSLENPAVLTGQLLCAAAELPLVDDDRLRFGHGFDRSLADLTQEGLVSTGPAGHTFSGGFRPASAVRLDGRSEDAVELRVGGEILEVLERWRAVRTAHEGAIVLHAGQRYRVLELDLSVGRADAEPIEVTEHTEAVVVRDYRLSEPVTSRSLGSWQLRLGPTAIRQQVVGYKLRRRGEVVSTAPLELPPVELDTWAISLVPTTPLSLPQGTRRDASGSLHAAEHGLIHAMPLLAMCERDDAGGLSTVLDATSGGPLILLYDGHEGGAGVAEVAYERFDDLASITLAMVQSCDCERGCPRCVYDRSCGNGNEPMDRIGAVEILRSIVGRPTEDGLAAAG